MTLLKPVAKPSTVLELLYRHEYEYLYLVLRSGHRALASNSHREVARWEMVSFKLL